MAQASVFRRAALLPRTITAVAGGALLLLAAWVGGIVWLWVTILLAALAALEYVGLHRRFLPAVRVSVVAVAATLTLIAAVISDPRVLLLGLGAIVVLLGVAPWLRAGLDPHRFAPGPAVAAIVGPAYLGLPHGVLARWRLDASFAQVAWMFSIVWAGDMASYFVGLAFGRHKLAPTVSPAKSWEGAAAGLIASGAAGWAAAVAFRLSPATGLLLGVVTGLAAQIGDLFESALKRRAGVKDSGGLLPGHGGVLDRFDAVYFAAPVAYALLKLWERV